MFRPAPRGALATRLTGVERRRAARFACGRIPTLGFFVARVAATLGTVRGGWGSEIARSERCASAGSTCPVTSVNADTLTIRRCRLQGAARHCVLCVRLNIRVHRGDLLRRNVGHERSLRYGRNGGACLIRSIARFHRVVAERRFEALQASAAARGESLQRRVRRLRLAVALRADCKEGGVDRELRTLRRIAAHNARERLQCRGM